VRFPHAQIHTLLILVIFITVIRIPAVVYLGFWIVFETLRAAATEPGNAGDCLSCPCGGVFGWGGAVAPVAGTAGLIERNWG
jgi:hypothetical protein